VAELVAM